MYSDISLRACHLTEGVEGVRALDLFLGTECEADRKYLVYDQLGLKLTWGGGGKGGGGGEGEEEEPAQLVSLH